MRISHETSRSGRELPLWQNFRAYWKSFGLACSFEWTTRSRFLMAEFRVDPGEREWSIAIGAYLFSFWLSVDVPWKAYWEWHKARWKYEEMAFGVDWNMADGAVSGGFLHWQWWAPMHSWSSTTPKWRDGTFHPLDWLLGRHVMTDRDIESGEFEIPMPEGNYPCTIRLYESTWKRPGWFIPHRVRRADIKMVVGVPHPGKGENSWDCGEDACSSMTTPASSFAEAIGSMVASTMRQRLNYGSKHWRPENPAPIAR